MNYILVHLAPKALLVWVVLWLPSPSSGGTPVGPYLGSSYTMAAPDGTGRLGASEFRLWSDYLPGEVAGIGGHPQISTAIRWCLGLNFGSRCAVELSGSARDAIRGVIVHPKYKYHGGIYRVSAIENLAIQEYRLAGIWRLAPSGRFQVRSGVEVLNCVFGEQAYLVETGRRIVDETSLDVIIGLFVGANFESPIYGQSYFCAELSRSWAGYDTIALDNQPLSVELGGWGASVGIRVYLPSSSTGEERSSRDRLQLR